VAAGAGGAACTLKAAKIGFDSDYEFFRDKCDSSTDTATSMVEAWLNASNPIYERDAGVTHILSTLVVRTDPATDIYAVFPDGSDFAGLLNLVRDHWNANMTAVEHDSFTLLTGSPIRSTAGPRHVGVVWQPATPYGVGMGGWGSGRHLPPRGWGTAGTAGPAARRARVHHVRRVAPAFSLYHVRIMRSFRDSRTCPRGRRRHRRARGALLRPSPCSPSRARAPSPSPRWKGATTRTATASSSRSTTAAPPPGGGGSAAIHLPGGPQTLSTFPRTDLAGKDSFRYTIADGTGFEATSVALVECPARALVLHLPLDETSGTDAGNASGYGPPGELRGDIDFAARRRRGGSARRSPRGRDDEYIFRSRATRTSPAGGGITVAAGSRVDAFAGDGETIVAKGAMPGG